MCVCACRYDNLSKVAIEKQVSDLAKTQLTNSAPPNKPSSATDFFLKRTAHVGGLGLQWQQGPESGERAITKFFEDKYGAGSILAVVLRQRAPTAESGPHNSWALVTFAEKEPLDEIMAGQETARLPTGVDDGRGGPPVNFVVRKISQQKALDSKGAFGAIFQECRRRVSVN